MPSIQNTRDCCKGVRAFYNAILTLIASNNIVAIIVSGIPVYLLISLSIMYGVQHNPAFTLFSSASYTIMALLLITWLLFAFATHKVYPNLMIISIFTYTCLGHWSLVSLLVMLTYGINYISSYVIKYLLSNFLPLIITLLFCGDVMRHVRRRLFDTIQNANINTIIDNGGLASTTSESGDDKLIV